MAFTTTIWLTRMISCADSTHGEQIIIRSHFLRRENQSSLASHYAPVHWISIFDLNRNKDEKLNGVKSVWWGAAIKWEELVFCILQYCPLCHYKLSAYANVYVWFCMCVKCRDWWTIKTSCRQELWVMDPLCAIRIHSSLLFLCSQGHTQASPVHLFPYLSHLFSRWSCCFFTFQ